MNYELLKLILFASLVSTMETAALGRRTVVNSGAAEPTDEQPVNKASANEKNMDVGANLFVDNLDPEVDEKLLFDTFSEFGVILQPPKIMRDVETGSSKCHAFINFASFEASDAALEAMNGQFLCNRPITCSYAFKKDTKGERHGTTAERLLAAQNPLFPQDRPHQIFPARIPAPFEGIPPLPPTPPVPFSNGIVSPPPPVLSGTIAPAGMAMGFLPHDATASLPKAPMQMHQMGQMFTPPHADYAIKIMNMIKLFGKPIKVNKASANEKNMDVGANLFVGNLDPEVDEKLLFDTFSAFGVILQPPKIMRDVETGSSKGHAFINFASFEASDAALEAMNGQFLCNRPITCSYAFKKDTKGERHGTTDAASSATAAAQRIRQKRGRSWAKKFEQRAEMARWMDKVYDSLFGPSKDEYNWDIIALIGFVVVAFEQRFTDDDERQAALDRLPELKENEGADKVIRFNSTCNAESRISCLSGIDTEFVRRLCH
ncbi:hypothetical protein niasHT_032829 [Heterodera trifolii]|uniref:Splicing factor 3B subunit 4 n=1 Tax=Heterodera trifolii TaxID=157864 RepID=A0ABD2IY82_9BILA